jgi:hypothetical protein
MAKSTKNAHAFHAVELGMRTLSKAEFEVVAGGVRDNPYLDHLNQVAAKQNEAQGTLGGSIGDPYVNGQPIF